MQRKEMAHKKIKETLVLKSNVEESIKMLRVMEEEKLEEKNRRKKEIEQRIEARKKKAFERDQLNRISNQVIKEINSYKVSLPDIYFKKYEPTDEKDALNEVLLTNV
jgi:outer membrane protein assembly factor BamA